MSLHCPTCGCKSCRCCRKCGRPYDCNCNTGHIASTRTKPKPPPPKKPRVEVVRKTLTMNREVEDIITYLKLHLEIDEAEVYRKALSLLFAAAKAEKIVAHVKDKDGNIVEQEIIGIK